MLKAIVTLLFLASTCAAQSSSDGSFSVRHVTEHSHPLTAVQMHEAEKLYRNACAAVQRDLHIGVELRPRFTVLLGAPNNEVHNGAEIWLTKWNPQMFVEGAVVVAFDQVLTPDAIKRLAKRAILDSNAMVDVTELRETR